MTAKNSSTICELYPLGLPGWCGTIGAVINLKKKLLRAGFAAYILLMLWLLFIRFRGVELTDYWSQLPGRINLIPFSSLGSMLRTLWHNPYPAVLWTVVYNIGGNIHMFVPLGFFLRVLFPKCHRFLRCMGTVVLIMSTVELCQLLTLRGFCEVDDVLLNVAGAAIGWWIAKRACCKMLQQVQEKREE